METLLNHRETVPHSASGLFLVHPSLCKKEEMKNGMVVLKGMVPQMSLDTAVLHDAASLPARSGFYCSHIACIPGYSHRLTSMRRLYLFIHFSSPRS